MHYVRQLMNVKKYHKVMLRSNNEMATRLLDNNN